MKVPKGSVMPKPIFDTTHIADPTPSIHVTVPMTVPIKGKMPNIFAQSILATWKKDKTKLKHVQVQFTGLTVNNPVKDSTQPVPQVCAHPTTGPTTTTCTVDSDCAAGTCAADASKQCHANSECEADRFLQRCVTLHRRRHARVAPLGRGQWRLGGVCRAVAARDARAIPIATVHETEHSPDVEEKFKFDEYVPADGSIHIKVSGRSFDCLHGLFGHNLKELLGFYGFTDGGECLLNGGSHDAGTVDITLNGPDFGRHRAR